MFIARSGSRQAVVDDEYTGKSPAATRIWKTRTLGNAGI